MGGEEALSWDAVQVLEDRPDDTDGRVGVDAVQTLGGVSGLSRGGAS